MITNSTVTFEGYSTSFPSEGDCNPNNETFDCVHSFYCRGQFIGRFCVPGCQMGPCFIPPLGKPSDIDSEYKFDEIELELVSNEEFLHFNISPNPTKGDLKLFCSNQIINSDFSSNITIYSFDGTVAQNIKNPVFNGGELDLNVYNLNPGPYKIVLTSHGEIVFQTTFIKI